jgi:hypothetical protein
MSCYRCSPKIRNKIDQLLAKRHLIEDKIDSQTTSEEKKRIRRSVFKIEEKINEIDPNWKRWNKYKT